jgi:hypothetical protein
MHGIIHLQVVIIMAYIERLEIQRSFHLFGVSRRM